MITLYTTHCPKCKVLEKKLNEKNVKYTVCDDENKMESLCIMSAPVLEIDGERLDFSKAIAWVNGR